MSLTHPDVQKVQPWRMLISTDTEDPDLCDICATTDKTWARLQLAENVKLLYWDQDSIVIPSVNSTGDPTHFQRYTKRRDGK